MIDDGDGDGIGWCPYLALEGDNRPGVLLITYIMIDDGSGVGNDVR